MPAFEYYAPEELEGVVDLLARFGEDARIIAGGQSLLILIRQELVQPRVLISLDRVASLQQVSMRDGALCLGAMATQRQLAQEAAVRERFPVLAQAAARVGSVHVQNLGTVGGNLSHAEPNGDSAPALISLGGSLCISSRRGERMMPVEDFFRGPFENALEPDEVLTRIDIPGPGSNCASVYFKHVLRGIDRAIVGVGMMMEIEEGVCKRARIGLCGAAPTPIRALEAESLLEGQAVTGPVIEAIEAAVIRNCDPLTDGHGPAEYKKKMAGVFVRRAMQQLTSSRGERTGSAGS